MALPPLRTDGTLPPGLHQIANLNELFVVFPAGAAQRQSLDAELRRFVDVVQRRGLGVLLGIDGSYTTGKAAPHDIDLVMLSPGLVASTIEQQLQAEGIDIAQALDLWIEATQIGFDGWVQFFSTPRQRGGSTRGVVLLPLTTITPGA